MTSMWGAPLRSRWRGSRRRDSEQARFLTVASLKWVIANRRTPRVPGPLLPPGEVHTRQPAHHHPRHGLLGKNVEIHSTPGLSRMRSAVGAHRRRQRAALPRGFAADRDRSSSARTTRTPTSTSRSARPPSSPTGAHLRLRPPHGTTSTCRSRTRHRQGTGADRTRHLDRRQGDGAAQHPGRSWLRARRPAWVKGDIPYFSIAVGSPRRR